jgi:hypothetical protein
VRRAATAVAVAVTLALAACGTPSPDLFVVHRSGSVPGAKLDLLVSDTTVRCNLGAARPLSSAQTLEARDITKDLLELQRAKTALPPAPPAQIFRFAVRSEAGTLRYGDTTQRPSVLPRLSRFTRDVAVGLCGLQR